MNIVSIRERSRSLVRDLAGGYFSDTDLRLYANEAIDRIKQIIPELRGMKNIQTPADQIIILPEEWQHLISVYVAARLCTQDERFYQATTFMNEFELKLSELKSSIEAGETILVDPKTNKAIPLHIVHESVKNVYYPNRYGIIPKYADEEVIW